MIIHIYIYIAVIWDWLLSVCVSMCLFPLVGDRLMKYSLWE